MAPRDKCSVCGKNVGKNDAAVECETCCAWYHISCVAIPAEFYSLLGVNKNLSFNCTRCRSKPSLKCSDQKLNGFITELENKLTDGIHLLDKKISASINSFTAEMRAEQQSLRALIESTAVGIRSDFSEAIEKVKADVLNCNKKCSDVDMKVLPKLENLDLEYNKLSRKMNRADIIVTGLPAGIDDLTSTVLKICAHYKVMVGSRDINYCLYMQNKKSVLCRFNNVHLRDEIMRAYFKSSGLKLCDVVDTNVSSRVYLNDNLTPAGLRLYSLCRTLKNNKKIIWFRLLNRDVPLCKIKFPDGSEKILDYGQCLEI